MFGIRHQLDVGLSNPVEDDVVKFRLSRDFGGLASGTTLSFAAAGDRHSRGVPPGRASTCTSRCSATGKPSSSSLPSRYSRVRAWHRVGLIWQMEDAAAISRRSEPAVFARLD